MKSKINIHFRIYLLILFPALLGAGLIFFQLFKLVTVQSAYYRQFAHQYSIKRFKVNPERGKIFSADGKLLAINVPKYNVWFDPMVVKSDKDYYAHVPPLARGLAKYVGKTPAYWEKKLKERRKQRRRYLFIGENIDFQTFNQIKKLPLFKRGRFKGGFVYESIHAREYPFGDILRRTIGRSDEKIKYGIEGAYDKILSGKPGWQLKHKINSKYWKPVNDFNEVDPVDGKDLVLSVDMQFQDIAYQTLLKQLQKYNADHGCVVIMEAQTGFIKAIVNLGQKTDGAYHEIRNYAVGENYEPGSVFKPFTFLALLEDNKVDTNTVFTIENNVYQYYDLKIRDAHHYETPLKMTVSEALAKSSNIVTVMMTDKFYRQNPVAFVNRISDGFGLGRKLGVDIKGEAQPVIPHPDDKENWKVYKLGMMAYGYTVKLTPLQILAYYNAFANGGIVLKPQFVEKILHNGKETRIKPVVINRQLAGKENLNKLAFMLRKVVTEGTATNLNSPYVAIAGKTGTTQTEYWTGNTQYIASFAGWFPYEKPQYSMIVVIHKPDKNIGYYGNAVAGTVFREIAEQIQGLTPDTIYVALKNN